MLHEKIAEDIIGAAIAVLNELKPGLDENPSTSSSAVDLIADLLTPCASVSAFTNFPQIMPQTAK